MILVTNVTSIHPLFLFLNYLFVTHGEKFQHLLFQICIFHIFYHIGGNKTGFFFNFIIFSSQFKTNNKYKLIRCVNSHDRPHVLYVESCMFLWIWSIRIVSRIGLIRGHTAFIRWLNYCVFSVQLPLGWFYAKYPFSMFDITIISWQHITVTL
jgi:hypothetical protein